MSTEVRVRLATREDLLLVFAWANDPVTREMSFSRAPIPLETHTAWFEKAIGASGTRLLIAEARLSGEWAPVGQVRVDETGEVGLSIAREFRGRRLSVPVLRAALDDFTRHAAPRRIVAHIKRGNAASIRAFEEVGFAFVRETAVKGQPCLEYAIALDEPKRSGDRSRASRS